MSAIAGAAVETTPIDEDIQQIFAAGGPLAKAIPGYSERVQQVEFASEVARAIHANEVLIAEAGTGTGKTVAYIVPALLYGGKVVISTGTKTLQDQLFHRDLPMVRDALGVAATSALLKGRANYACHYHLERNLADGRLPSRDAVSHLQLIARFAKQSQTGDRAEAPEVPEDSPAWALATSTRENCLGQNCPDFSDCFVMKARRAALEADIVVVNHHLFFADAMLRDEGMAELLPAANTVILDEAHQLPDTASLFFGESVSTAQVLDLTRDVLAESLTAARDVPELQPIVRAVDKGARDLRLAVPAKDTRLPASKLRDYPALTPAVAALIDTLLRLSMALEALAERSEGLESCARRSAEILTRLKRWQATDEPEMIRWVDAFSQSLALHITPLSVAEPFRKQMDGRPRAWILTSATLAVGTDFSLYQERMGLEDARTASWPSPFDYAANALLYLPTNLPEPSATNFTDAVVEAALPVLRASGGRAFMLFTTLRGMRRAHEVLTEAFEREGLTYPLLVQGQGSRTDLLDRFRAIGNAVLVASASFWEGVDVRGETLSVVVIDKLPFAPPDDPVLAARLEALERSGRNAFVEYQVPQAAIALKQGAGRLIRDERDRGVLVICDTRLASRGYGRKILASLPAMRRTRVLADVEAFFEKAAPS
ncbi:MAG: ATP-dependent DNA helicase [Burkholderiales bacterium]